MLTCSKLPPSNLQKTQASEDTGEDQYQEVAKSYVGRGESTCVRAYIPGTVVGVDPLMGGSTLPTAAVVAWETTPLGKLANPLPVFMYPAEELMAPRRPLGKKPPTLPFPIVRMLMICESTGTF